MRTQQVQPENSNPQLQTGQQQNPAANGSGAAAKQKVRRKPIALKPQNLQTEKGIKKLYQLTQQINWSDAMTTQSAMNLVALTLKSWQYQMMPKYSTQYFLQRCTALGSDKLVSAYMHKVRRIHKGIQQWDHPKTDNPTNPNTINTERNQNHDPQKSTAGDIDKFRQRAQLAKKLASTTISQPKTDKQVLAHVNKTGNQAQIDQMMDEDLRMFEEMSRQRASHKNTNNNNNKGKQSDDDNGVQLQIDSGFPNDDYYDD